MESFGLLLGMALLLTVSTCAVLLGRKANKGVQQFREERHESFLGRRR